MLGHVFALGRPFFDFFSFFFGHRICIVVLHRFFIVFFDFGSIFGGFGMVLGGFGDGFFHDFLYYNQKSRFLKT